MGYGCRIEYTGTEFWCKSCRMVHKRTTFDEHDGHFLMRIRIQPSQLYYGHVCLTCNTTDVILEEKYA